VFVEKEVYTKLTPHENAHILRQIEANTVIDVNDLVSIHGEEWLYVTVPVYDSPSNMKGWIKRSQAIPYTKELTKKVQGDVYIAKGTPIYEVDQFKDINENAGDNKEVIVEASEVTINKVKMIEIRIIHIGSFSNSSVKDLEETITENGGNFGTIYDSLLSVCDWSIDNLYNDRIHHIHYLHSHIDGIDDSRVYSTSEKVPSRGFTHILRFYK